MYYLNPKTGKTTRVAFVGKEWVVYYSNKDGKEKAVIKWCFREQILCDDEKELFVQCLKYGVKQK